jgi:hypothetical protein
VEAAAVALASAFLSSIFALEAAADGQTRQLVVVYDFVGVIPGIHSVNRSLQWFV